MLHAEKTEARQAGLAGRAKGDHCPTFNVTDSSLDLLTSLRYGYTTPQFFLALRNDSCPA